MLKKLVLAAAALASLATATITMSGSAEARDCRKWQCHRQFHFRENNWQDQYQPYYNDGTYLRGGGFFGGPGIFFGAPFPFYGDQVYWHRHHRHCGVHRVWHHHHLVFRRTCW